MTTEFSTGQHVGDYEILSILGHGGMGKVYKVRNIISDRVEAMKILLPDLNSNQSLADRFLREIRLLATLNHPNIAALRTALTYENQLVMIMEFVEGETLANRLARAPLSTAEAVNYSEQVLAALSYAHKQNIIHRDIKPANMMLTPQGVVKLMDFGIARSSTDGSLTSTGTTLGSLNYMPPEQVRGEGADARSDIYSFGVSLYEMLTGKLPFQSDSQYALMTAHLNETPPAPITLREDLPPGLNEIIMIAISKNPSERFQSADAFRNALSTVPVANLPRSSTTVTPTPRASSGQTTIMDIPPRTPAPVTPARATGAPAAAASAPARTIPMTPTPTPATSMAGAAASSGPAPAAPGAPRSSGSRTVWLALGAVLGVAVVISAAVYVPRRFGTHADPSKSAFPGNSTAANVAGEVANNALSQAASNAASSANQNASANPSNPIVSVDGPGGSVKVDANGSVSTNGPGGNVNVDTSNGAVSVSGPGGNVAVNAGSANNSANASAKSSGKKSAAQSSAAPAPPPSPSPEDLAKAADEADKLGIRAEAVNRSIDTMREQQTAQGYNLRPDINASQSRLQFYLSRANNALNAQDLATAQKYFDQAEAELTKLERFLGH